MNSGDNRRLAQRLDKVFSIYISGAWGTAFGIARNISEGGMFIETPDPYPLGSKMEVTFSLPGTDTEMSATAEVVHIYFLNRTPGGGRRGLVVGMGIRFLDFTEEQPQWSRPLDAAVVQ